MQSVFILFPIFIGLLFLDGNSVLAGRAYRRRRRRERRAQQALNELNHTTACKFVNYIFSNGSNTCLASPLKSYADLYLKADLVRLWDFKQSECIPQSDIMVKQVKLSAWELFYCLVIICLVLEFLFTGDSSLNYLLRVVPA
jgi:hypothetical protein